MRVLIFLSIVLQCFVLAAQEKIYVPFFACEGCSKQIGVSSAHIFKEYIDEKASFIAELAQIRDTTSPVESFNDARESAELISCKYFVIGKIVKLADLYHISITLYATSSGLKFWKGRNQTGNVMDIPVILKKLSTKIANDYVMSKQGDVFLVSSDDAIEVERFRSNKGIGVITGAQLPMSERKIENINPGFGVQTSFDARRFILELSGEIYFGKDSIEVPTVIEDVNNRYYNLTINAIYPLSTTNSAPFACLGSGFSYRETDVKTLSAQGEELHWRVTEQGLFFNAGGGYILNRNSDTPLFIYVRAYVFMPNLGVVTYGVMINFAIHIERW